MGAVIAKIIQIFLSRGKYLVLKRKLKEFIKKRYSPITEEAFKKLLTDSCSLKSGDVVFVHSAIGNLNIDFPPAKILDLLLEVIGEEGTVLFPCWHFLNRAEDFHQGEHPIFDVRKTRSKLGFLTEWARMNKKSKRSLHPTNSIVAIGKDANHFVFEHHQDIYPCGVKSPFYKLIKAKAKIIGLGVDVDNLSFLHCIEDVDPSLFNVKIRTEKVYEIEVINEVGENQIVKTVLADKEIGRRDPIKFFNNYIRKETCLRFSDSGSSFFMTRADLLNEELITQAKKGNTIYSVVD